MLKDLVVPKKQFHAEEEKLRKNQSQTYISRVKNRSRKLKEEPGAPRPIKKKEAGN